ncbi:hypothetical protein GCM10020220_109220 [Nonomuraea rubra]
MTDRDNLLAEIKNKAIVHGKVTLSSGKEADFYLDLRRITLDGVAAPLVGSVMLDLTADLDYEAVGGLTMGADPVAGRDVARGGRPGAGAGRVRGAEGAERPMGCSGASKGPR